VGCVHRPHAGKTRRKTRRTGPFAVRSPFLAAPDRDAARQFAARGRHGRCDASRVTPSRALSLAAAAYFAAGWAANIGETFAAVLALAALALGSAIVAFSETESARRRLAVALLACLGAGAAGFGLAGDDPPRGPAPDGLHRVEGEVDEIAYTDDEPRATIDVAAAERIDGTPPVAGARIELRAEGLVPGDRVAALVRLRPVLTYRNPLPTLATPEPAISARGEVVGEPEILDRHAPSALVDGVRASVRSALERSLSDRSAALARALVLGDESAIGREDRENVRGSGLAHVIAVSGLHVVIVAGLLLAIVERALRRIPAIAARTDTRRLASAIGIPVVLLYAELAGGAPSAWRASITAALAFGLIAAGRRPAPVPITALAAILFACFDPEHARSIGYLLSIAATAAIVAFDAGDLETFRGKLRAALLLGVRTTLATAPILYFYFGSVPLVGLVANLVLVPFGSFVLVPLANLHALVATLVPVLGPMTAALFEPCALGFLAAARAFAEIDPDLALPPPSAIELAALSAACFSLVFLRGRTRLVCAALALLALGLGEVELRHRADAGDSLRVTFLDVGQGDAAIVDLPDGTRMLVDAGGDPLGRADPGTRSVLAVLEARRVHSIDVAVMSHPHPDHYAGFAPLLDAIAFRELWDTGQARAEQPDSAAAKLRDEFERRGVRVLSPGVLCGEWWFGATRVEVLWPCPAHDSGLGENDNSFVLALTHGRRRLLFTGDVEALAETELVRLGGRLRADVLKVPHHGSRTSSSPALLDRVRPSLAIASSGRANRFGHPHPDVVARFRERGIALFRTDEDGGVEVTTDGRSIAARAWSGRVFELRKTDWRADRSLP
jgi:competence protein ComEC